VGAASPDRPWVVLQHVDYQGPGTLATALRAAGLGFETVRCDLDEALPAHDEVTGLVVMGGPMGVHDTEDHPWLAGERQLLADAVAAGAPVVGIGLGAQQLAMSLGATVTPGALEVGPGEVVLTADGRRDAVLGPEYGGLATTTLACLHWHRDAFSLPEGALRLAASRATACQAFRHGARAYGFQFHLEADRGVVEQWAGRLPNGVGLDPSALTRAETVGRRLAGRLIAAVTR
jgi:GMP synthase (glutamine-hydrolysing)